MIKRKRNRGLTALNKQDSILVGDVTQPSVDNEGHTNMLTALPQNSLMESNNGEMNGQASIMINNDFVGKNKNMLSFFREHDQEKRQAFNRLRDYFSMRAKFNRTMSQEAKRQKVIHYMQRWDDYRVRRDHVIEGILRARRRQSSCSYMLVLAALALRFKKIEVTLENERERKRKAERETARQKKLA